MKAALLGESRGALCAATLFVALILFCGGEQATSGGPTCTPDETLCNDSCAALYKDPENCGSCGTTCAQGTVCYQGACATSCGPGTTQCGQSCVDPNVDPDHCGSCDTPCKPSEACTGGKCAPLCASGQTRCTATDDDVCTDLTIDSLNCGACGHACPTDASCNGGTCVCADSSKTACGTTCTDVSSDDANCGACGSVCAGSCAKGRCAIALATGLTSPSGMIIDATNVYWTDRGAGTVSSVSKNGGAVTVLASGQAAPHELATDGTNLFWDDLNATPLTFGSVPMGGGSVTLVVAQGHISANALLVDSQNIYWDAVYSMPKTGGAVTYLPSQPGVVGAVDAVMAGTWMYGVSSQGVMRVSIYGAYDPLEYVSGALGVAVDSTNLYWSFSASNNYTGIATTTLDGKAPVATVTLAQNPITYGRLRVDEGNVYFAQSCTPNCAGISRVPVGGGPTTLLVDELNVVAGFAVDATSVYWTDYTGGRIMKLTPK